MLSRGDTACDLEELLGHRRRKPPGECDVAVSRARCLAVLVCSPQLLTIHCRNVEQMRLVNALCLLVELAQQ
jgi:hypothetical protein